MIDPKRHTYVLFIDGKHDYCNACRYRDEDAPDCTECAIDGGKPTNFAPKGAKMLKGGKK